jgi:hypothetical protein
VTEDHGIDIIKDGIAVMFNDGGYLKYANNYFQKKEGTLPFHFVKETVVRLIVGFVLNKANYSMTQLFDPDIGRLTDSGIIQKFFLQETPPKDSFSRYGVESYVLDLGHFTSTFLLYGVLLIASVLIFIIELYKNPYIELKKTLPVRLSWPRNISREQQFT